MKKKSKKMISNEDQNIQQTPKSRLSPDLIEEFERFVEYHPAKRLARNLRSLLLEFLMFDGSTEAEYLKDLAVDLDGLYSLLDAVEQELKGEVV